jgi:hypothetical protein
MYVTGMAIGLDTLDLEFLPHKPFTGCRICGKVFQSALDRDHPFDGLPEHMQLSRGWEALRRRKAWSIRHAKTHTSTQHRDLQMSGAWCTPEAAQILASYGVISLTDIIMNAEVSTALHQSSAVPVDDVEGVRY